MNKKNIKLYTIHYNWKDEDETNFAIVGVGSPDFLDKLAEDWTEAEEEYDARIFHYYNDYAELNQQLKDGAETREDFVVTKIISSIDEVSSADKELFEHLDKYKYIKSSWFNLKGSIGTEAL